MNMGTRSVLYGAHCAVIHPWFLAVAWWKLYGFPWDGRLWAAFWLHDIGYFSKRDMDGSDGETHVELGARIMSLLFGESWGTFTAAHSRYWAKRNGRQFSRLCVADKLGFVMTQHGCTCQWRVRQASSPSICCGPKNVRRVASILRLSNLRS